MEHGKGDPPPERDRRHPPHPIMSWTPGVDLPPFEAGITQAVELALALKRTRALLQVPDLVSQAVALPRRASSFGHKSAPGLLQ